MEKRADKIEDALIGLASYEDSLDLLDEYILTISSLKESASDYPYLQAIRIQEIIDTIESRLPRVSGRTFEQYVIYANLLAICLN